MSSRVKKCDFEKCLELDAILFSGVNHISINGASLRFVLRWSIGLYLPSGNRARCNAFPNRKFGLGPGSFRRTATDWCFKRTNVAARTAAAKNSDKTAAATRIIFEEVMQKLPYLWHNHKVYIIAWLNKVRGTSVHLECPSIKCFASACSCLFAAMIYFCAEILGPRLLISETLLISGFGSSLSRSLLPQKTHKIYRSRFALVKKFELGL